MRLLDLNADVLEHISSWILSIDIHAWRVSCKPLAAVSKPYRFRHVTLKSASAVRNFHAFLDRTSVGVFSVVIAIPGGITTVAHYHNMQTLNQTLLPQLLIRAPGLRCLKVSGGGVDMSLLRHLVGCPRLEELGLPDMWEGMHPALFETLLTAALPLRILALPVYRHTHHVIALLQSCALTLETVECTGNLFDEQDPVVSCPKVHTLVLHLARHVVWTTLRAMFPAVRTLHVEGHLIPGQTAPSEADGGRRTAPGTRVDVLSGTVCGVHVLDNHGLQVSLLALDRCRGRGACTKPAAALSQVLAWARPEMLSVRLPLAAYDTALGLSPGAHGVVVLELILEAPHEPFDLMAGKPPPVRLGHLRKVLPPMIAELPSLRYMRVVFGRHCDQSIVMGVRTPLAQALFAGSQSLVLLGFASEDPRVARTMLRRAEAGQVLRSTSSKGPQVRKPLFATDMRADAEFGAASMTELRRRREAEGAAVFDASW